MLKHWQEHHHDLEHLPKFQFKIVGSYQDALSRQVSKAVRIDMRGGGVLNSKSEYSRCKLPLLTIDRDTRNSQKQAKSSIDTGAEKDLEKLSMKLEENLARPETRAFLKFGNRRGKSCDWTLW